MKNFHLNRYPEKVFTKVIFHLLLIYYTSMFIGISILFVKEYRIPVVIISSEVYLSPENLTKSDFAPCF